jgi:hypothetical protein
MFLPGGAKYLDVPGLLCLASVQPLWVAGEPDATLFPAASIHQAGEEARASAAAWLSR